MNTTQILEKIVDTDFYKSLVQEEVSKTIEQRKQAAASIEVIEREALKTAKDLQAKLSKKEKELQDAKDRVNTLKIEKLALEKKQWDSGNASNNKKAGLEVFLKKTADSRIDDALALLSKKRQALLAKEPTFSAGNKRTDFATLAIKMDHFTNVSTIEEGLEYTKYGSDTLEEMKLEPVLDEKKLQDLLSGLSAKTVSLGVR